MRTVNEIISRPYLIWPVRILAALMLCLLIGVSVSHCIVHVWAKQHPSSVEKSAVQPTQARLLHP